MNCSDICVRTDWAASLPSFRFLHLTRDYVINGFRLKMTTRNDVVNSLLASLLIA